MSKTNYLTVDSCFWQQIIDQETNRKRNFQPFDSELLYVAQSFLNSYKSLIKRK
jgi:hypothetical protein